MRNPICFFVVVRRENERFVKESVRHSRYAAEKLRQAWEGQYDETFSISIEPKLS